MSRAGVHTSATPTVTVSTRAFWRVRLRRELPRYAILLLALAGLASSARFAIAPPRPIATASPREPAPADRAAEAYAVLFARRYLTWNSAEPQESARALEPFLGSGMEPDAGVQLPTDGAQRVEWAEPVQAREPVAGEHVYTVAAQTDSGLLYVTVPVARVDGALALAGYPAFVGAPASEPAFVPAHLREVTEHPLAVVVQRALRNYLASSASELAADLTAGAQVSLPPQQLTLESMQRLQWAPVGASVIATVQAQDEHGVRYTLAYELDVAREQGRWEISAIQTDPDEYTGPKEER
ncbi:MAG TPA: conjugal transfer protein [Solirubrobacteraceae bacterium]|nr:conjugal transfer protein [Solirubrobacteraceae bacterium]